MRCPNLPHYILLELPSILPCSKIKLPIPISQAFAKGCLIAKDSIRTDKLTILLCIWYMYLFIIISFHNVWISYDYTVHIVRRYHIPGIPYFVKERDTIFIQACICWPMLSLKTTANQAWFWLLTLTINFENAWRGCPLRLCRKVHLDLSLRQNR